MKPKTKGGTRSRELKYLYEILRSDENGLRRDRDGHGDHFLCAPDDVIRRLERAMRKLAGD
ncbi:hypothetical protein [Deinococcus sp. S9]|uniref:hypothetical protein n=1 Tax=Deinococcus sp. S9 TaxID=2545754 RepID=UPI00140501F7|nr:hypothetical protein [Deinococcus sp. S9]